MAPRHRKLDRKEIDHDGNVKSENINNKTKRKESKIREKSLKRTPFKPIVTAVVIIFGIVALFAIALKSHKYYEDNYLQKPLSVKIREFSEMLINLADIAETMNSQGEPDPMDVILTKRLGPIQNRVSSLRTQIRQHEELLGKIKVPGGPTNFIDTTLRELNSFLDISFPQLDDEVDVILQNMLMRTGTPQKLALMQKIGNTQQKWLRLVEWTRTEVLEKEGISFFPGEAFLPVAEGMDANTFVNSFTLRDGELGESIEHGRRIADKLAKLGELFEQREKIRELIKEHLVENGHRVQAARMEVDFPGVLEELYDSPEEHGFEDPYVLLALNEKIDEALGEEIDENYLHYEMTLMVTNQLMIRSGTVEHSAYEQMANNLPYLKLKNSIVNDIVRLIDRVERLKT
ncbi:hypothetical protein Fcan01_17250 [Folsomia candida]|uniref:Uncharacterized protein n=1 Tax=Folsomia candida TaxID=158441 RepID=A0A226DSU7_FOLCA|nr:hypothetical protein Fcan01_17250 [Folsomia candida]